MRTTCWRRKRSGYYPKENNGDNEGNFESEGESDAIVGDVIYEKEIDTKTLPKSGSARLFNFNIEDKLPEFKGIYEPVAAELVVLVRLGHVPDAPAAQRFEDRLEFVPGAGQPEQCRGDGRGGFLAPHQAGPLELPEAVREQVGGDARQPALQVGVPARALQEELPDDEQGPPVTDHVECLGYRAVLAVGPHDPRVPEMWLTTRTYCLTF